MPTVQLITGSRAGMRWPVLGDRFVIGRGATCDAVLNELPPRGKTRDSVSRYHALLSRRDGHWFVEDGDGRGKHSLNGTFLNDVKLNAPTKLKDQDQIRICNQICVFRTDPDSTFSVEASVRHDDSDKSLHSQPAERLTVLLEISAALRGTLETDDVLDRTLDSLFKAFPYAERGLVVFREDTTSPIVVRAVRTPKGDPADPNFSTTIVDQCLAKVEAILGNDLPAQFPDCESVDGLLPGRSLIITPLWLPDGQALGAIQLESRSDRRKFTQDDLKFLLGVANQASIALTNARLHRDSLRHQRRMRDLEVAQHVQRALLPSVVPVVPGYGFHAYYESAQEVGGDYYDFVPLAGGRLAVLLGDVAGKGVSAALVMAKFSVEARVCLESFADPAEAVYQLNARMVRAAVPEKFVTLIAFVLDPATHSVVIVNAGHPSPLLIRSGGGIEDAAGDDISDLPIGIADGIPYQSRELKLEPGDRLLVFSDGVSESLNAYEKLFGTDGIRQACSEPCHCAKVTVEKVLEAVKRHAGGFGQTDDIAVVCLAREKS